MTRRRSKIKQYFFGMKYLYSASYFFADIMMTMSLLKLTFILFQIPTGSYANSGCGSCDMWTYCENRTHTCCLDANVSYSLDSLKWNFQPRYVGMF